MKPDTTILIARSTPKPHASGAAGNWFCEYRVVCEYGMWHLAHRYCPDVDDSECDVHTGEWEPISPPFETPFDACCEYGDSKFIKAESLHELHSLTLERDKLVQQIYAIDNRTIGKAADKREAQLKQEANDRYHALLKEHRLYSKAQQGKAPMDKISKLQAQAHAEYLDARSRWRDEVAELVEERNALADKLDPLMRKALEIEA